MKQVSKTLELYDMAKRSVEPRCKTSLVTKRNALLELFPVGMTSAEPCTLEQHSESVPWVS